MIKTMKFLFALLFLVCTQAGLSRTAFTTVQAAIKDM